MHPMFVHESNNIISVSDGTQNLCFEYPEFLKIEPTYQISTDIQSVNYEKRGPNLLYVVTYKDGSTEGFITPNHVYESLIENFAKYKNFYDDIKHPLYKLTDDDAKKYVVDSLTYKFERDNNLNLGFYTELEKNTWSLQEKEACAWLENNLVETPFIDAIRKDGETKQEQVDKIISNVNEWNQNNSVLIKYVREQRELVYAMTREQVKQKYDEEFPKIIS